MHRQFSGKSGLTGTLQTGYQYDCRFTFYVYVFRAAAHKFGQLVLDYFYEYLLRVERSMYTCAYGLFLDAVGEFFGYLVVYVGIYQHAAYFLGRFSYLYLAYLVVALDYLQGAVQLFAQIFKHIPKCVCFFWGMRFFSNYKFSHFSCFPVILSGAFSRKNRFSCFIYAGRKTHGTVSCDCNEKIRKGYPFRIL